MTWHDIVVDDYDPDSPLVENTLGDIHNNQEELLAVPIDVQFDQVGHSQTPYASLISREIFIPSMLAVSSSTWQLVMSFGRRMDGGIGVYAVRGRLNGSSWITKGAFNNTTYVADTFVFNDTVLRLAALQGNVLYEIEGQIDSVEDVQVRNIGVEGASRIEKL